MAAWRAYCAGCGKIVRIVLLDQLSENRHEFVFSRVIMSILRSRSMIRFIPFLGLSLCVSIMQIDLV